MAAQSTQTIAHHAVADARGLRLLQLAFGAIGVVYGDIGTSPLYAIRECFGATACRPSR